MSYQTTIKPKHDNEQPIDTIQQILWCPFDRDSLFTGGWDGLVRLYTIEGHTSKSLEKKWEFFFGHPVISFDANNNQLVFAGLATGDIALIDMRNAQNFVWLGKHDAPICKVIWLQNFQTLLSLGYDDLIKVYQLNQNQNGNFQTAQYKLPAKTNTASFSYPFLLIGSQDGKVALLNVSKLQETNIANQYQTLLDSNYGIVKYNCSAVSENRKRLALGTPDGRLITTSFQDGYNGIKIDKPFVTKYQKTTSYRKDFCGQINGVDIGCKDMKYEFCVLGGSEQICFHSIEKNNKIKSLSQQSVPTTAVSIRPDGDYMAWATGNDWSRGLESVLEVKIPKIQVLKITTSEVVPSSYMR